MERQGFKVNQSKISRLLRKLGAIKIVEGRGETVYRLPKEPGPPSAYTAVGHLVIDVAHNENLVVIRTSPGSASMIARVLDYQLQAIESLGSIAGDDTIIVIPQSIKNIQHTFKTIKNLLLG